MLNENKDEPYDNSRKCVICAQQRFEMCAKELFGVYDFTFERIHLIFGIKMYIEIYKKT